MINFFIPSLQVTPFISPSYHPSLLFSSIPETLFSFLKLLLNSNHHMHSPRSHLTYCFLCANLLTSFHWPNVLNIELISANLVHSLSPHYLLELSGFISVILGNDSRITKIILEQLKASVSKPHLLALCAHADDMNPYTMILPHIAVQETRLTFL